MTQRSHRRRLRERLAEGPVLVVAGAPNALTARIVEDVGFEAVYVTGAGIANTFLGVPDIGLVTLTEIEAHVAAIRDAVDVPLIVDADTGFGNALNVARTVTVLERAGADALQLEDQVTPKRCGHFNDKAVVAAREMECKIEAACQSRRDDDLVIIARTDARAIEGFDAALDRADRYARAGADVTFVEAPETQAELLEIPRRLDAPQVVNLVGGGRTPILPVQQLEEFGIALFANLALQAAIGGMHKALTVLRDTGTFPTEDGIASWEERQRIVHKPYYDELEQRYTPGGVMAAGGDDHRRR